MDPTTATLTGLHSLGVALRRQEKTSSPDRPLCRQICLPAMNRGVSNAFPYKNVLRTFISIADLTNVRSLYTQTRSGRCLGLCIERQYGDRETLGQWDPANVEATAVLYEYETDQPLEALTFFFTSAFSIEGSHNQQRYCSGVSVGSGGSVDGEFFTCTDVNRVSVKFVTVVIIF